MISDKNYQIIKNSSKGLHIKAKNENIKLISEDEKIIDPTIK